MPKTRKVDITPDVSLLKKAGEVNYRVPTAIAELVDNPIDARLPGRKLTVEVKLRIRKAGNEIIVSDNASGMTDDEVEKAMKMGYSEKSGDKIGEFGLGLKTATSNLGRHVEIVTATESSDVAHRLVYDEIKFIEAGEWTLEIEELENKPFPHGTVITITDLKVNLYGGVKDTLLGRVGKTFRHFISSGEVEILVNGDAAEPYQYPTIPEYDTELATEINGKLVRGWVSLAESRSSKSGYGFDLVRRNRVVVENVKIGIPAGQATSTMIGELHLDDFDVVNNKVDFRRGTDDWVALTEWLESGVLDDLKREARKKANPGQLDKRSEAEVETFIGDVRKALQSEELHVDLDRRALDASLDAAERGDTDPTLSNDQLRAPSGLTTVEDFRHSRAKTVLRNLTVIHEVMPLGRGTAYKTWDVDGVGVHKRLTVRTNQDHAMYEAFGEDFLLWVKHNIAEAVAEYFTESSGLTQQMLDIKSDILKHVASIELAVEVEVAAAAAESEKTGT
jgi:hypothetical protein